MYLVWSKNISKVYLPYHMLRAFSEYKVRERITKEFFVRQINSTVREMC